MNLSQALEAVGAVYVPGVVAHYEKQTPDPWQRAHDDLESAALTLNQNAIEIGSDRFVHRCKELIGRFKKEGAVTQDISPADALHLGCVDRVNRWASIKQKHCVHCEGKERLKIVPVEPGSVSVVIVCETCMKEKAIA